MTTAPGEACSSWDNSGCVGTPSCPPRCPRYVDQEDTAFVIRPYEPADHDYDALTLSVSKGNRRAIHVYWKVEFEPEAADVGPSPVGVDLEMRLPLDGAAAQRVRPPPAER